MAMQEPQSGLVTSMSSRADQAHRRTPTLRGQLPDPGQLKGCKISLDCPSLAPCPLNTIFFNVDSSSGLARSAGYMSRSGAARNAAGEGGTFDSPHVPSDGDCEKVEYAGSQVDERRILQAPTTAAEVDRSKPPKVPHLEAHADSRASHQTQKKRASGQLERDPPRPGDELNKFPLFDVHQITAGVIFSSVVPRGCHQGGDLRGMPQAVKAFPQCLPLQLGFMTGIGHGR